MASANPVPRWRRTPALQHALRSGGRFTPAMRPPPQADDVHPEEHQIEHEQQPEARAGVQCGENDVAGQPDLEPCPHFARVQLRADIRGSEANGLKTPVPERNGVER